MLHSIFKRAVPDQLIVTNPCEHNELPTVIARKSRTLTPDEFDAPIRAVPEPHRLMVETAIETGKHWDALIALSPRHIDFLRRTTHRRSNRVRRPAPTTSASSFRCAPRLDPMARRGSWMGGIVTSSRPFVGPGR